MLPVQAVVVVAVFAAAGAGCGWLWYHLWDAPTGTVANGQWLTDEAGLRDDFQGVGWYVAIATLGGLLLGTVLSWLLDRSELVTLLAVAVGSVLAAYLMLLVGTHLSPGDPDVLAKTAKNGVKLKGDLRVRTWPPRGAFPFGALLGLAVVYFVSAGRERKPQPRTGTPE